ncbi:MAG: hypothetical protein ACYCXQ_13090 [Candidatus Humimicrobiaceae bacterium]
MPKDIFNYKYSSVKIEGQFIEGYLGNWVKKNITHELLEFPKEVYLWPYYTSGITIKWPLEDF